MADPVRRSSTVKIKYSHVVSTQGYWSQKLKASWCNNVPSWFL